MTKIYRLLCTETGKSYIGKTKHEIEDRFHEHVHGSKFGGKSKLSNALRKYGPEKFEKYLLEETSEELSNEREKHFVEFYDSFHNGYNSTRAGEWVPKPPVTDETRDKMSRNNRWRGKPRYGVENPNYGKKWSDELKRNQSEKMKGKQTRLGAVLSDETKKKISDSRKGKTFENAKGLKRSEETKKRISASKTGKRIEKTRKEYIIIDPDGKTFTIKGLVDFCNEYGLHKGNIFSNSGSKGYRAIKKIAGKKYKING